MLQIVGGYGTKNDDKELRVVDDRQKSHEVRPVDQPFFLSPYVTSTLCRCDPRV